MDGSKGMERDRVRASSTDGKGDGKGGAARPDAARIAISVFGSALTVAVALAALILTSAHYTREQFHDQNELMRRHFAEQFALIREHSDSQLEQVRAHSDSQLALMRAHTDSQFEQVRDDLRDVRGDLREVRDDVRALAERQAKVEGLLLAAHRTEAAAPPPAGGASLSPSHPEEPASE